MPMTDHNSVLAPCPFCGGNAVLLIHVDRQDDVRLMCGVATCGAAITWWHPRAEAIAAWNRRTPVEPVLPSEASTSSPSPQERGIREALEKAAKVADRYAHGSGDNAVGKRCAAVAKAIRSLSSVGMNRSQQDDILIRLRRAYDETGNELLGDALDEIARRRKTAELQQPTPCGCTYAPDELKR